jgi:hypothetical protein
LSRQGKNISGGAENFQYFILISKRNYDDDQAEEEGKKYTLTGGLTGLRMLSGAEHARGKRTGADARTNADGTKYYLNGETHG